MPDRIDPRLLRGHMRPAGAEPGLRLTRTTAAPSAAPDLKALETGAAAATAILKRADAELPALLRRVAGDLNVTPPTPLMATNLSGPGSTVQLGVDFPGNTINAFRAAQVFRSSSGQGSYIRLTAPEQQANFQVQLPNPCEGIYLAVVHAGGSAATLKMRGWLYPSGFVGEDANRTTDKFLIPFEVTGYAWLLSMFFEIPAGQSGDLEIYRVDITKVT